MKKLILICALAMSSWAVAAPASILTVPSGWRLQNYTGGALVVWYTTASTCTTGKLTLPAGNESQRNRFWALVLAAKTASRKVLVEYDDSTCVISSFGLLEG
ncbi:hypothetical protein [Aquirhabdus parva]|uniref:Uncharacterized protein n=1 Tax=Aquirhabdus parva TaxID=2283318 RepID=A0A345P2G2_9GAMM|nr:hypothetical protein [Aquirhabdus parva]AXI01471.1 hypothetical protein HYN46_00290 [Aquirhabdus parva]